MNAAHDSDSWQRWQTLLAPTDEQFEAAEQALENSSPREKDRLARRLWGVRFHAGVEARLGRVKQALALLAQVQPGTPAPVYRGSEAPAWPALEAAQQELLSRELGGEEAARQALDDSCGAYAVTLVTDGGQVTTRLRWRGRVALQAGELHVELATPVGAWLQAGLELPPGRYVARVELVLGDEPSGLPVELYPDQREELVRLDGILAVPADLGPLRSLEGELPAGMVRVGLQPLGAG
jgi:hypothetical protein